MAKKRKKHGRRSSRRRISGISKNSTLIMLASAAGGYFFGQKLNDKLTDPTTGPLKNVDPKLLAAGEVAIGLFGKKALPARLQKNMVVELAAGILLGAGIHEGLKSFGIVSGVPVLAGYRDIKTISGIPTPAVNNNNGSSLNSMQIISGVMSDTNCMN